MTKTDNRLRLLNAENAALWGVVRALRKAIAAETKLCDRFRPGIVVEMSKREWKRQKPLYEALVDQHDAAERDLNAALDALDKFERGDVA